jgi:predicted nucleic acid-binding protein
MPGSFLDSNVLLYLALEDQRKAARSEELLVQGGMISVQVLNEIANVARRKYQKPWAEIEDFLGLIRSFLRVMPVTLEIHEMGLALAQRHGFAIYDSMLVSAALSGGCDVLWSEDMQDGLLIDSRLRIANPFKGS